MTSDYPKKYWWLILVVIPIVLAVIQIYPNIGNGDDNGSGTQPDPPKPVPPTPAPQPSVKEIVTSPSRMALQVGETGVVRAELRDAQGSTLSGPDVSWKSGNDTIAIVSGSGRVTATSQGITIISAQSDGELATTEVTVTPVPLAHIRVVPEQFSIFAGDTFPLKAELRDTRGKLVDRPVEWESTNDDIAIVTTTGVVKGFRFGIVKIVAKREGMRGCAKLFIGNPKTGMYPIEVGATDNSDACL